MPSPSIQLGHHERERAEKQQRIEDYTRELGSRPPSTPNENEALR